MARKKELTSEESRLRLFEQLRAAKPGIVATTAKDTGIDPVHIEPAFERVMELVEEPVPTAERLAQWRDQGEQLARSGAPTERVLDGYLSLNWAIWEAVMGLGGYPPHDHPRIR